MAAIEPLPATLIELSPEGIEIHNGGRDIIEPTEGSLPLQPGELIQENRLARTSDVETVSTVTLSPETKPLDEYTSPLTHELIEYRYVGLISGTTDRMLLDVVPGSQQYEEVRQRAKKEITQKFLWKMGLPSEYIKYLDIDNAETRELLDQEYFAIPEEVDRDNSSNSFRNRQEKIKDHILETSKQDDIEARLQATTEIWIGDLALRAGIMESNEPTPNQKTNAVRQTFLEKLITNEGATHDLITNIGNTLLHASDRERVHFYERLRSLTPDTESTSRRIAKLVAYVEEHHLPENY